MTLPVTYLIIKTISIQKLVCLEHQTEQRQLTMLDYVVQLIFQ